MTDDADSTVVQTPASPLRDRLRGSDGKLLARVGLIFVVMTVLLVVFGVWWPGATMPVTASDTEQAVHVTMIVFSVAAAPVMALVWAIAYYSARHWGHGGETPPEDGPPIRGNNRIYGTWLLVSSVLTAFLLIWGLSEFTATTTVATAAEPLVVNVKAQQWVWTFFYPQDGNIGSTDLVLPINRPVVFEVSSVDVIHSFWVPEMGIKVDANPEVTTETNTTPNLLGTFNVRCAELCGFNHSYMQTTATVMSSADFNAWITQHGGVPGQQSTSNGG